MDGEIVARVERRRQWTLEEKAGLMAEVEAAGGQVSVVARRHGISKSLLYNWRSAWRSAAGAAAARASSAVSTGFIQLGVVTEPREQLPLPSACPRGAGLSLAERVGHRDRLARRGAPARRRSRQREGAAAGAGGDEGEMIGLAPGTKVFLACQPIDLRAGFDGLSAKVQQIIGADPFSGHVFIFRSKRGHYLKGLYWDGSGLCLFAKRLERGKFVWPPIVDGTLTPTPAQMALLIEAMDWRRTVAPPLPARPMLV